MYDVGVRLGLNAIGKPMIRFFRVRDVDLSTYIRGIQDSGKYVFSVRSLVPLHKQRIDQDQFDNELKESGFYSEEKLEEVRRQVDPVDTEAVDDYEKGREVTIDPIDHRIMIDSHGF